MENRSLREAGSWATFAWVWNRKEFFRTNHIFHFLPMSYITYTIIPVINRYAKKDHPKWIDLEL